MINKTYKKIAHKFKKKNKMDNHWAERMKKDWNDRALENAMHYIMTDKPDWIWEEFFDSGEEDVKRFVDPFLKKYKTNNYGRILELGCGIGRLTVALARRFKHVDAVDVSEEMIKKAREIHEDKKNITFMINNGKNLNCCKSKQYDFVFSYIVLQHIPDVDIIYDYYKEFGRVLRLNGLFLFQVANNDMLGHEKYLQRWQQRRDAYEKENKIIPFEDYDYAYLESKINLNPA